MMFCDRYDAILFALVLTQIYGTFGLDTDTYEDGIIAFVRLGSVLALIFMCYADIRGRRSVLLGSMVAFSVGTFLIGVAPNLWFLLGMQFFVRCFADGVNFLAPVMLVEEIPEPHRGWAMGALVAIAGQGQGLALVLFTAVNVWPQGWRLLYLIGGCPLFFFFWARRALPESHRFLAVSSAHEAESTCKEVCSGVLQRWGALFTDYPLRLVAILLIAFIVPFNDAGASTLGPTYFQTAQNFTPGMYSGLALGSGFIAACTKTLFGRLSDRIGRRPVLGIGISGGAIGIALMYVAPNYYVLIPAYFIMNFSGAMYNIMLNALAAELFPTRYRSTASGLVNTVTVAAIPIGMGWHNVVRIFLDDHFGESPHAKWTAVAFCASLNFFVPLLLLLLPSAAVLAAMEGEASGSMSSEGPGGDDREGVPVPWAILPELPNDLSASPPHSV